MTSISQPERHIAIFLYDGAQPIDVAGPMQTFDTANEEAGGSAYKCRAVSYRGGSIRLQGGLSVLTEPVRYRSIDTLFIPGGPGVHRARKSAEIMLSVTRLAALSGRICSVCTGAFLLAQAGLLDGLNAATHWRSCAALAKEFPNVRVQPDPIWIKQDRVWTSAGVTAGIDLSLALVESDLGSALAAKTARRLVVYMRRAGGQDQFSTPLALQTADGFGPLFDWLDQNLHKSIKVTDLAAQANMSGRSFARHFTEKLGMTPAKAVEGLRLERAQSLLSTTTLSLSDVARRTGFGREERLREVFERRFSIGPTQWRARFSESA